MQSMLSLQAPYGLPLCVSGINQHFILFEEMADHDCRREAIKKQKSKRGRGSLHANQEIIRVEGNFERVVEETAEVDGDHRAIVLSRYLSSRSRLACTAKAA